MQLMVLEIPSVEEIEDKMDVRFERQDLFTMSAECLASWTSKA